MRHAPRLTVTEHRALGAELRRIRNELMEVHTGTVGPRYAIASKQMRRARAAHMAVDALRDVMDKAASDEYPGKSADLYF